MAPRSAVGRHELLTPHHCSYSRCWTFHEGPHLERLADDERERFLDAVMVRLDERPLLDYVRLDIVARR